MNLKDYLTIPQAAKRKGLTRAAIHSRCKVGTLPHRRIGRTVFISPAALDRWQPKKTGPKTIATKE